MDDHGLEKENGQPAAAPSGSIPGWVEKQVVDYAALESVLGWDGSAKIYDWDDSYGEVGPRFATLELELFGDPATRPPRTGLDFTK